MQIYDIDCYCRKEVKLSVVITTEEATHVDFFLRLGLFLGFLCGSGTTSGGGTTCSGGASSGSGGDISEESTDILSGESLGEKSGPVRLYGVSGGLDNLVELVSLK